MMVPPRPFRFGVHTALGDSLAAWQETARRAEGLGYAVLTTWDHPDPQLAFGPALLAAALATERLRVGTLVLDNNLRHPALVALEAATLALFTGGRFELGLGAGWRAENYTRLGLPFDPTGVRFGRLADAVPIVKGLLGAGPVSFAGAHYTIAELPGYGDGGRPRPPLLIGAGGPRMLALAGREADTVSILPQALPGGGVRIAELAAESMAEKIAVVRAAAAGRDALPEINILVQAVVVTLDRRSAAEAIAPRWELDADAVLASPAALLGTPEQIAEDLLARRAQFGLSYISVQARDMDALAPVVARLVGR